MTSAASIVVDQEALVPPMDRVDVYYGLFFEGPITMPCGAKAWLAGYDQLCPNSGKCSSGHGECWVERYQEKEE